uniref:Mitochondrial import inner membrane translocase subunit TIM50 n=3 Tax=Cacopsylla melanoneura TaxID=428564 RepID=A0A8D9AGL7_9HEMI
MSAILLRYILPPCTFQQNMSKFLVRKSFGKYAVQTFPTHAFSRQLVNKIDQQCVSHLFNGNNSMHVLRISSVLCRYYSDSKVKGAFLNLGTTSSQNVDQKQSGKQSSNEDTNKKKSKFTKYAIYTLCIVYGGLFISILYNLGLPPLDEEGLELKDEFSHLPPVEQFFKRMFDRLYIFKEFLRRPSFDKLLPDPSPSDQPKFTLVLELTHVLLHPDWTYQTGWRFKKRPNLDHFLEQMASPMFEVVVFTSQAGMNMSPIVEALNRGAGGNYISYTLYRDATEFINGEHVKNLACLNRDLSKVIVIDWNPNAIHLHPENSLILPKWAGNDDDNTLVELVAFLKSVAEQSPSDVRDILRHYKQFSDPMEQFRESQRKLPLLPLPASPTHV